MLSNILTVLSVLFLIATLPTGRTEPTGGITPAVGWASSS